jgi:flagellar biosynthesis protein FlhA
MIIGILQRDLSFDTAIQTYTILTIGDGLVSQVPSLIISLASGLLVTKSGVIGSADKAIFGQLSEYPQSLWMTSAVTFMMSIAPGLPFIPFFVLALCTAAAGYFVYRGKNDIQDRPTGSVQTSKESQTVGNNGSVAQENKEAVSTFMQMDVIRLEVGYGLLSLVDSKHGQRLTEQIKSLRKQIIKDYGFVMQSVRIQDNIQLEPEAYIIKIKELEAARGFVRVGKFLVMDPKSQPIEIPGENVKEPSFSLPAKWVDANHKDEALFNSYTVVDAATVITTHLTEVIKENITELLSYAETQKLVEDIGEQHKKLVKDIIPDTVPISTLQKVLQNLLAEMISIRDLPAILEAVAEASRANKNVTTITEAVRVRLSRQICHMNLCSEGFIPVIALSPEWERIFIQNIVTDSENNKQLAISPSQLQEFISLIRKAYDNQASQGYVPVLLTGSIIRPYVRMIIERFRSSIAVMSQAEIHNKYKIRTLAMIG